MGAGIAGGVVNTLAGGASFLTVPLLVTLGLPATVANATNRVGVFAQSLSAVAGFRQEGMRDLSVALRILPVMLVASWIGAKLASSLGDEVFGRAFGAIMLLAMPVILWNPKPRADAASRPPLPQWIQQVTYFAIGLYTGAIQAGVGIPLTLALVGVGRLDLVGASSAKVALIAATTAVALAQFAWAGKVVWTTGLILATGMAIGGYVGSRIGARAGERLLRPVLTATVVFFAIRMLMGGKG
ncbi:MAG: sulfite exporter TauE/SafE family protein [bacterium]